MHISELKEAKKILYFEGEYAIFRAVDEHGMYRGMINRKGEIIWNDKWRHIVMRIHGYPSILKTVNGTKEFVYYDVEKHAFVDPPVIDDSKKSRAQLMVENAPEKPFFSYAPGLFDVPSLRYLSDEFVGFYKDRNWGVQDLDGNVVLPPAFSHVGAGGEPNHFVVRLDDREGVMDDKGNWIIPRIYHSIHWRRAYYVAYIKEPNKEAKAGLLDKTGKVLVPFVYDFLDPAYTEDLISALKRGKFLFINSKNEKIDLFNL